MATEQQTFGQKVMKTTKKVTLIIALSIVVLGIAIFSFYYWGVYEDGVRAGTVLRITEQGVVFKTYEGQLNLETFGSLKGTSPLAEAFDFSVSDEAVVKDLEAVALTGERVNLHYIRRYAKFPWRGATKYFVVKVERLGPNAAPAAPATPAEPR